jgi:hypothetical protein
MRTKFVKKGIEAIKRLAMCKKEKDAEQFEFNGEVK